MSTALAQQRVAITVDDAPGYASGKHTRLLTVMDSLSIPVAIFINEGLVHKTDSVASQKVLEQWALRPYATLGNHTYAHTRYSEVGFEAFTADIEKGEKLTRPLLQKRGRKLMYFRFPFNDLGNDSVQHRQIKEYLNERSYVSVPFTIESADYLYNNAYEYYLNNKDIANAKRTGQMYIAKTLEFFDYFEKLSVALYGRNIPHIYLCHDNALNAAYLPQLIKALRERKYNFISLEEALTDKVYDNEDTYYKKWGISWVYRWLASDKERTAYMQAEPSLEEIERITAALKN